jgi:hypothetical protein
VAEPWALQEFVERFDAWAERESPSADLRYIVLNWVMSRADTPFAGARREPGFPNLWFAVIPDSHNGAGEMVTCSYWIEVTARVVRCDLFGTLSPPFI